MDLVERRGQLVLAAAAGAAGAAWWLRRAAASGASAPVAANSFVAYLKDRSVGVQPAAPPQKKYAPTSFDAYLKQADPAAHAAPAAAAAAAAGPAAPPEAKPLTVLYGTEYGFSKEVAEKACSALKGAGYWPQLLDMADLPQGLPGLGQPGCHQALLLVCSTQVRCTLADGSCAALASCGGDVISAAAPLPASAGLAALHRRRPARCRCRATACRPRKPESSATGWPAGRRRS